MFCAKAKVPGNEGWFDQIKAYETEVLAKRV
jgi:L-rhamnose isomerase